VKRSPLGDRASLDLARSAMEALDLGADDVPDLLAVSLSACDYVGHYYGPETLEAEDAFVRLNQELASFLDVVRQRVPTDRLLIVVSADHGGTERADSLRSAGLPGRRLTIADLGAVTRATLSSLHHERGATLPFYVVPPYVTLDREALESAGLDWRGTVRRVAEALAKAPGVHSAFVTAEIEGVDELSKKVQDSIYPGRSGDIYVVPEPHTLLLQEDELGATHGSPWSYDSRVPIVLHGAGIPQGRVARPVEVTSLAPTVSRWLGIEPPAGASTTLLTEAWSRESPAPMPPR
jgi:predicted AlkP superfamily pyrophosphatase or phosphodiesterase